MKIQYASDLHLEFETNSQYLRQHPLRVTGDILILAGDIAYLGDDSYTNHPFWDWASENYKQVICCMGNHEFYRYYDIATLHDGFSLEVRYNIHTYYNTVVHLEDTDIIVSTLWGHIPQQEAYYTEYVISDFHRILCEGNRLTPQSFNKENERCIRFIKQAVSSSQAKTKIVVTHHVPSFQMQCPRFADSHSNGAFTVELQDYIAQSTIDFWIYGHSHYNTDKTIGTTPCLTNQLGYVHHNEHRTFDPGKSLQI